MPTDEGKRNEMIRALESVINILIDGQKGFADLGEHVEDPMLKKCFLGESLTRARFRGELEEILHQAGVHDVKESGSTIGALHRAWGDLKARFGTSDHSLLETAEQGEDEAKKAYEDALEQDLPLPVRQVLAEQQEHILQIHDTVRNYRDTLATK